MCYCCLPVNESQRFSLFLFFFLVKVSKKKANAKNFQFPGQQTFSFLVLLYNSKWKTFSIPRLPISFFSEALDFPGRSRSFQTPSTFWRVERFKSF
jgi:hypothetical protein